MVVSAVKGVVIFVLMGNLFNRICLRRAAARTGECKNTLIDTAGLLGDLTVIVYVIDKLGFSTLVYDDSARRAYVVSRVSLYGAGRRLDVLLDRSLVITVICRIVREIRGSRCSVGLLGGGNVFRRRGAREAVVPSGAVVSEVLPVLQDVSNVQMTSIIATIEDIRRFVFIVTPSLKVKLNILYHIYVRYSNYYNTCKVNCQPFCQNLCVLFATNFYYKNYMQKALRFYPKSQTKKRPPTQNRVEGLLCYLIFY